MSASARSATAGRSRTAWDGKPAAMQAVLSTASKSSYFRQMDTDALMDRLSLFWPKVENTVTAMLQPWRLYQIGILLACFLIAHLLNRWLSPRLRARMQEMNATKARLRLMLVIFHRLRGLIFVALAWAAVVALQAVTWPSRSHLVALGASLATAWVFVAITTRLIHNRVLRLLVAWGAWAFVTLHILGWLDEAEIALDRAAVTLGEVRLSLLLLLKAAVTLGLLLTLASWIGRLIVARIDRDEDISPSMKVLSDKLIRIGLFAIAIVAALQAVGFDMTSLTVLSGAIGLGLGFGLQKIVSNLVSGVILLLDKSIKPGDVISIGETFGWITSLGARCVSVLTRDGREYLIPNEDLITGQVVNWSRSSDLVRLDICFGVSYESDPHFVRKIVVQATQAVPRVADDPAPVCHIVGFGDSSIDFMTRFWIHDPNKGLTNVRGAVYLAIWDALKANGVEIPYPKRDVTIVDARETAERAAAE
jgi:small-conductance mechanosensitive channel